MADDSLDPIEPQTILKVCTKKWSDLETRQLITLYEKNEILWNVGRKDYRNRTKKQEVLWSISNKLNIDMAEVQRKLHNLRSQFNSELKKIKKAKSGNATDEANYSNWLYFDALKFIQHSKSARAMKDTTADESSEEIELEEEQAPKFMYASSPLAEQVSLQTPPNKKMKINQTQDMPSYIKNAMRQLNQHVDLENVTNQNAMRHLHQPSDLEHVTNQNPLRHLHQPSDQEHIINQNAMRHFNQPFDQEHVTNHNAMRHLNRPIDPEQVFADFCATEMRLLKIPANKRLFKKIVLETVTNIAEADAVGAIYKPGVSFESYAQQTPPPTNSPSTSSSEYSFTPQYMQPAMAPQAQPEQTSFLSDLNSQSTYNVED